MNSFKLDNGKPKIINCAGCNEEISNKAASCPKCGNPVKKKSSPVAIGCLTVFIFFGIVGACADELADVNDSMEGRGASTASSSVSIPAEKRISVIDFNELDNIYASGSSYTDLQKDAYWKKYKGKRVTWTGEVHDVRNGLFGGLKLGIKMKRSTFTSDLSIELRKDQEGKAVQISKGQRISFTGTLTTWGSILPISMEDGVIN